MPASSSINLPPLMITSREDLLQATQNELKQSCVDVPCATGRGMTDDVGVITWKLELRCKRMR
jgi:hypothetical protein